MWLVPDEDDQVENGQEDQVGAQGVLNDLNSNLDSCTYVHIPDEAIYCTKSSRGFNVAQHQFHTGVGVSHGNNMGMSVLTAQDADAHTYCNRETEYFEAIHEIDPYAVAYMESIRG
ncbi:hypothetical protein Bbelb_267550 [Branchiostoma belcheri]|nr:hypothetical protein Bbelb_267550 [Branchiostoma belcheri]